MGFLFGLFRAFEGRFIGVIDIVQCSHLSGGPNSIMCSPEFYGLFGRKHSASAGLFQEPTDSWEQSECDSTSSIRDEGIGGAVDNSDGNRVGRLNFG